MKSKIIVPSRIRIAHSRILDYADATQNDWPGGELQAARTLARAACTGLYHLGLTDEATEADALRVLANGNAMRAFADSLLDSPKRDTVPEAIVSAIHELIKPVAVFDSALAEMLQDGFVPGPFAINQLVICPVMDDYQRLARIVAPELDYLNGCPLGGMKTVDEVVADFAECLRGVWEPRVIEATDHDEYWRCKSVECQCHIRYLLDLCKRIAANPASDKTHETTETTQALKIPKFRPENPNNWQDIKKELERLRGKSKRPCPSKRALAKQLRCSRSTIDKAMDNSIGLTAWYALAKQAETPRAMGLGDIELDNTAQSTERDTLAILIDDQDRDYEPSPLDDRRRRSAQQHKQV